ncbi:carbamoyl phosphate synthase small subunit [Spiroplasma turonicum]|uniref:Carbamoyl phosphate synthase small chain n=1 Tax=Spiroplasma turonicum TaxID=216946 RepID=A0A0K1P6T2_9MOLU|nr:carbamoyl phosphate synthase small subunit [Spiroplasma turonicum]AKU80016.1 GMP synthase [Spiroplasma turonicum]ALX71018.1 carbamoyl-phosphate synthase small subunit [Spiroplasma turonicum]
MKRWLILSDGTIFEGSALGNDVSVINEIVFTTAMTGYQESITDQSYNGQILIFTYPLVGNYGINNEDNESIFPTCSGIVVKENCEVGSNFRNKMSLSNFLKNKKITGISDIDTRMLTNKIRDNGTLTAAIVCKESEIQLFLEKLKNFKPKTNHVEEVSTKNIYYIPGNRYKAVLIDFGLKISITKELSKRDCGVFVVPYNITTDEINKLNPDGIMLSNGPGDPKNLPDQIEMIKELQLKYPIFGICLGHQLLALANGLNTKKMLFGHRGINHPVKDYENNKCYITSQNHGYVVDENSINKDIVEITHRSLNDNCIEGLSYKNSKSFSVQFHPDSCPGTSDSYYLFDNFINSIRQGKEI